MHAAPSLHDTFLGSSDELCLFLSGTFIDLQAEREYLAKKIFPELRQLCRERGLAFTDIDLRWGITEQQARQGRVVELCLDEIRRRKPFVLAIVGDRYGWRPTEQELGTNPHLFLHYPWLRDTVAHGRSLTELESLEQTRHDPEMADRVRFFFKYKTDRAVRSGDADEIVSLAGFRTRVRRSGIPMREGFRTPQRLGEWVREEVLGILDRIAPENTAEGWLNRERRGHEAFAMSRRRAYVEHEPTLTALDEYVKEGAWREEENPIGEGTIRRAYPLLVTGDSGSGKSALLAWWSERFRRENPDAFLVTHFVGATSNSSDAVGLMRRIMTEIRERYDLQEEPPAEPERVREAFPEWLGHVGRDRFVLVIDALNQLDRAELLGWLPNDFPASMRVVISCLNGSIARMLTGRGWTQLQVRPLNRKQRTEVVRSFLSEYGKSLESRQAHRIAADHKTANPLYLRTSLEELRVAADHDRLNEQISYYLEAGDPGELYDRVLERVEKAYGKTFTAKAMRHLWAARRGLSEAELAGVMNVPQFEVVRLMQGIDYHLMRRDGLLVFHHDYLRRAVEIRYLKSKPGRKNAHRRIARWFSTQPMTIRRAEEEPWGWMEAEEWEGVIDGLSDVNALATVIQTDGGISANIYFRALSEPKRSGLLAQLKLCRTASRRGRGEKEGFVNSLYVVAQFLLESSFLEAADAVAACAYRHAIRLWSRRDAMSVAILTLRGSIAHDRGDVARARHIINESDGILMEGLLESAKAGLPEARNIADIADRLGALYLNVRGFKEAQRLKQIALNIRRRILGAGHSDTIRTRCDIGVVHFELGDYRTAQRYFEQCLEQSRAALGPLHPTTLMMLNNLAASYRDQNQSEKALDVLHQTLAANSRLYGVCHPTVAANYSNIGYFLLRSGDLNGAIDAYSRALEIYGSLYGEDHPATASCRVNIGSALIEAGSLDEALENYTAARRIRRQVYGSDHVLTKACEANMATVYMARGFHRRALRLLENSLHVREAALGSEHPIIVRTKARIETCRSGLKDRRRRAV